MTRRPSITVRLRSALALVGMIMSATVIVWAIPCGDECRSAMAEHSCCEPDLQPTDDTRATTSGCCGGTHMQCAQTATFESGDASSAQDRARDVAIARAARLLPRLERFPRTTANERAGPSRPPLAVPTKTIVLLI